MKTATLLGELHVGKGRVRNPVGRARRLFGHLWLFCWGNETVVTTRKRLHLRRLSDLG